MSRPLTYALLLCEPLGVDKQTLLTCTRKKSAFGLHSCIQVTEELYRSIKRGRCIEYEKKDDWHAHAYFFAPSKGPKKPEMCTIHVTGFMNDGGQVGLVDIQGITEEEAAEYETRVFANDDYDHMHDRSWYQSKLSRRILFNGETRGGDVGADVYGHQADGMKGVYDALVIDVSDCIFERRK